MKIPDSLSAKLSHGKYCKWAKDMDEDTFVALCWFIGESMIRSTDKCFSPATFSERHTCEHAHITRSRYDTGLEAVYEIFRGKEYSGENDEIFDVIRERLNEEISAR